MNACSFKLVLLESSAAEIGAPGHQPERHRMTRPGTGQMRSEACLSSKASGIRTADTGSSAKETVSVGIQNRLSKHTWDIWAAVLPLAPIRSMARAEEMLSGEINTFLELSSPSFFRSVKAKVPFASDRASMVASLKGWI